MSFFSPFLNYFCIVSGDLILRPLNSSYTGKGFLIIFLIYFMRVCPRLQPLIGRPRSKIAGAAPAYPDTQP